MESEVTFSAAFIAGVLSFFSPCILPLIPVYVTMVSGLSVEQLREGGLKKPTSNLAVGILLFILGFSFVFIFLGASAFFIGQALHEYREILTKIGGIIVVIFGVSLISGFVWQPFWSGSGRKNIRRTEMFFFPFVFGMAFALSWTPCVTPVLASILFLAGFSGTVWEGMGLLLVYSLGIAIPFFLSGIALGKFMFLFQHFKKYLKHVSVVSGIFLIAFGILIIFGRMSYLGQYFIQLFS